MGNISACSCDCATAREDKHYPQKYNCSDNLFDYHFTTFQFNIDFLQDLYIRLHIALCSVLLALHIV